ncbi:MAG TPA: DUF4863 family protein [Planctomycetota bacterium]|nr:DUF4863 family protein [Planctomycetota bacterium]
MSADTRETLVAAFAPLIDTLAATRFADVEATLAAAERAHPFRGPYVSELRRRLAAAAEAKVICDRGEPPVYWGRLAKAAPATRDFSIDAVLMTGPGPGHVHPNGEFSVAFALEGDPRFDGRPEGYVLEKPGSYHVPTVTGGKMLIVYFLPGGAMDFGAPKRG